MKKNIVRFRSVDDYIATFPEKVRDMLEDMRAVIKDSVPYAEEKISYQMPTFALKGNLVHFAAFKNHIGFFPTASGIDAFKKELSGYEHSKGMIKFPLNKPLPYKLIKRIVLFRVGENLKEAGKSNKGGIIRAR